LSRSFVVDLVPVAEVSPVEYFQAIA
jgi:hypothetical protein